MKITRRMPLQRWFDDQAEAAAGFYTGIFGKAGIVAVTPTPARLGRVNRRCVSSRGRRAVPAR